MKRFFCTICKKVKRVRVYPADIQDVYNETPDSRIGTCRRHHELKLVKPVKPVAVWTEANKVQAEGRMNRKQSRKVAR